MEIPHLSKLSRVKGVDNFPLLKLEDQTYYAELGQLFRGKLPSEA